MDKRSQRIGTFIFCLGILGAFIGLAYERHLTITAFNSLGGQFVTKSGVRSEVIGLFTAKMVSVDQRGTIISAGPKVTDLLGYEKGELNGKPLSILMTSELRSVHDAKFAKRILDPKFGETIRVDCPNAVKKDGTTIAIEIATEAFPNDDEILFLGSIRDPKSIVELKAK